MKIMPCAVKKPDSGEDLGLRLKVRPWRLHSKGRSGQARQPFPIIGIGASAGGLSYSLQRRG